MGNLPPQTVRLIVGISVGILLIASILVGVLVKPTTPMQTADSNVKEYYILALEKHEDGWGIHGLWPQYDTNTYPQNCEGIPYNHDKIVPIISTLEQYWGSNRGRDMDDWFWEHEWNKHGHCVFSPMTEVQYFKKVLDLFKKVTTEGIPKHFITTTHGIVTARIPFDKNFKMMTKEPGS